MLHFPIPKLSAVIDYNLDSNDFNSQDDANKIIEDIQAKKEYVMNLIRRITEEYCSKIKARNDVNFLLEKQKEAIQRRENLKKKLEQKLKTKQLVDQKNALYEKIINLYRKNLGFLMERIKCGTTDFSEGYSIHFKFQNICRNNPKKCASLVLMTDGTKYKVTSCQPSVDMLHEMVSELNDSNDLGKFICQIRRKFCAVANSM